MSTPEEKVTNGVQLLDEKIPGWHRRINTSTLNLSDSWNCICGQLAGDEESWVPIVDFLYGKTVTDDAFGWENFVVNNGFCCDALNHDLWVEAINTRLAIDKLPAPVEDLAIA